MAWCVRVLRIFCYGQVLYLILMHLVVNHVKILSVKFPKLKPCTQEQGYTELALQRMNWTGSNIEHLTNITQQPTKA